MDEQEPQDVSGEQHIAIDHNVYKRRLDLETGMPIDEPEKHEVVKDEEVKSENSTEVEEVKCGSCYGAETEDRKCCNTCEEVKQQYIRKSWKFEKVMRTHLVDKCTKE